MNYRHAFHAGNFADVLKHAVLARILLRLQEKSTPIRVIDTHGGIGLYDLFSDEAQRTGEWRDGIARLDQSLLAPEVEEWLAPYRKVVADCRQRHGEAIYPGSPTITAMLLRPIDKSLVFETHPQDHKRLLKALAWSNRTRVLALDGWTGLSANIPPPERRGLVLIDPPFEAADEFERLAAAVIAAWRKWSTGIYMVWYPVKDRALSDGFCERVLEAGVRKVLRLELAVDEQMPTGRLAGCGLLIINPPWTLAAEADIVLPALARRLATGARPSWRCERLSED